MKTALLALAALAGCTLLGGTAQAQRYSSITGAKLLEICSSRDPKLVTGCTAYIDGVSDTVSFYQRMRPSDGSRGQQLPNYICVPGSVTGVQLRQEVLDWIKKHPEKAQTIASGVVLQALDSIHLCPGEQRRIQE